MNHGASQREGGTVALGALAIVVAGAVIGLITNHFAARSVALFASEATLRATVATGVLYIDTTDAKSVLDAGTAVFVDARLPEEYAEGHIPGAVNLPADDFDETYPKLAKGLREASSIIAYCSDIQCDQGAKVADWLAERGHSGVYLMFSGWDEWEAAGYPSERAEGP